MSEEDLDYIISKLTKLLIKQHLKDKKDGVEYITKLDAYKDLIKLFKSMKK